MFSQVTDLAWNGLIIRWLQVQVLPGPQHTDQEKRPKGAFYLGRQATRPTLLVLPSLAPFRAISRVLRPKRGPNAAQDFERGDRLVTKGRRRWLCVGATRRQRQHAMN